MFNLKFNCIRNNFLSSTPVTSLLNVYFFKPKTNTFFFSFRIQLLAQIKSLQT